MRSLRNNATSRHAGFSLLEVLVVLIILLIGILAILRLFPGGFLTIQRTAEQTLSVQLGGQQLEYQRNLAGQPDYIVAALPDVNGGIHEISNITPDDIRQIDDTMILSYANGFTLPTGYSGYFFSNINKIRYVKGEANRIPVANPNIVDPGNVPYGSLLPLAHGPVYNYFDTNANPITDSIHVYGAALTRTIESAVATANQPDPRPTVQNDTLYAIDYQNRVIAFFPRLGKTASPTTYRDFQIVFDYYDTSTNPPVAKTQTGVIRVPDLDPTLYTSGAIPVPTWQPIFDPTLNPAPANSVLRQEGEEVSRLFKLITTDRLGNGPITSFQGNNAPAWSDDPYEYAWYSPQTSGANGNPGVLLFNPHGHVSFLTNSAITSAQSQANAQGFTNVQALVVRVDYLIYDNHIIADQRTVPANAPYTIKLSLPNVLTNGDILDDGTQYAGIFYGAPTTPDILILNANDGTEVSEMSQGTVPNGYVNFTLDSVTGAITFDQTGDAKHPSANTVRGVSVRILYRTQKNWATQIQKASSVYTAVSSPTAVNYKTYFIGDGTGGSLPTRIYFALSEAGKTVRIGEYYALKNGAVNYTPYRNESFKIEDNTANFDAVNLPYIDIADANHHLSDNLTGFTAAPTGRAVNDLLGISVKSRVLWGSTRRPRYIDQDSVLPTNRL